MTTLKFNPAAFVPTKPHAPCADSEAHRPHPHGVGDLRFAAVDMAHCHGVVCFSNRVHEPHGSCAGLDADTLFERMMDAAQ